MTSIGLFLTGTSLAVMAAWVSKTISKDDSHTPAEIAAALKHER